MPKKGKPGNAENQQKAYKNKKAPSVNVYRYYKTAKSNPFAI